MAPPFRSASIEELLQHDPLIRGLARALLRGDDRVDDVVQEVWLRAVQSGPETRGAGRAWLRTVTRNLVFGLRRRDGARERKLRNAPSRGAAPSTSEIAAREEIRRRIVEVLSTLDEKHRAPLVLRYYEDLPPREVARRLAIPVETARSRVRRGLQKLRTELDARHGNRRSWALALLPLVQGRGRLSKVAAAGAGLGLKAALVGGVALTCVATWVATRDDDGDPKHVADPRSRSLDSDRRGGATVARVPEDPPPVLRGTVRGPVGQPLDRAEVTRLRPLPRQTTFCDSEGRFTFALALRGRHLFEFGAGADFVAVRRVIDVSAQGEPEEVDVTLEAAGFVNGTLVAKGRPVTGAFVEIYRGEELVDETQSIAGVFAFEDEPPRDVPLRLEVTHPDLGILHPPRRFLYGGSVDLGEVALTPHARLDVELLLPHGGRSSDVGIYEWNEASRSRMQAIGHVNVLLRSERPRPGKHRYLLYDWGERSGVVREVKLKVGEHKFVRFEIPRGPRRAVAEIRSVDDRPLRARFETSGSKEAAESSREGRLVLSKAPGGVVSLKLTGLFVPGRGWCRTEGESYFLDTDARVPILRLELRRRILFQSGDPVQFTLSPTDTTDTRLGRDYWSAKDTDPAEDLWLSPPMRPGKTVLNRYVGGSRLAVRKPVVIEVREKGLAEIRLQGLRPPERLR